MPEVYQSYIQSAGGAETTAAITNALLIRSEGGKYSAIILANADKTKHWYWRFDHVLAMELGI